MIYAYCDGAVEPKNPGGWGVGGWVIKEWKLSVTADGAPIMVDITKGAVDLGEYPEMTNNIAEYGAVRGALQEMVRRKLWKERVVVRTDSQLVVNQITGKWQTFQPELVKLCDECRQLVQMFCGNLRFEWIPREENTEADEMSRSLYHGRMAPGLPPARFKKPKRKKST